MICLHSDNPFADFPDRQRGLVWSFRCPVCKLVFRESEASDVRIVKEQNGMGSRKASCPRCKAEAVPLPPAYYD